MECASDRLWGTGLPLSDPDCLDRTKWISQGILGQILEDIRNKFNEADRHHSQYAVSPSQPVLNAVAITTATISAANQSITHAQHEAASSGADPNPPEYVESTASASHTSGPETADDPSGKNMEVA